MSITSKANDSFNNGSTLLLRLLDGTTLLVPRKDILSLISVGQEDRCTLLLAGREPDQTIAKDVEGHAYKYVRPLNGYPSDEYVEKTFKPAVIEQQRERLTQALKQLGEDATETELYAMRHVTLRNLRYTNKTLTEQEEKYEKRKSRSLGLTVIDALYMRAVEKGEVPEDNRLVKWASMIFFTRDYVAKVSEHLSRISQNNSVKAEIHFYEDVQKHSRAVENPVSYDMLKERAADIEKRLQTNELDYESARLLDSRVQTYAYQNRPPVSETFRLYKDLSVPAIRYVYTRDGEGYEARRQHAVAFTSAPSP